MAKNGVRIKAVVTWGKTSRRRYESGKGEISFVLLNRKGGRRERGREKKRKTDTD